MFGLGQGVIILLVGSFLGAPGKGAVASTSAHRRKITQTRTDLMPVQVLSQPVFWLMYLMFVLVASGGLMAAAQIGPIARDYGIASVPLNLLGLVMPALTLAISLDRILDGFGRPFFGWVSDNIGRENTMFIAFAVAAMSLLLLTQLGHSPWMFVVLTALFFGVFGEIYSLFPATCGDTFGSKYAATNAGMLYTAKGTASALVPLASLVASLAAATYGWSAVFAIAVAFNVCAALLALFALKPLRAGFLRSGSGDRGDAVPLVVDAAALASETEPALSAGFAAQSRSDAAAQQQAVTLTAALSSSSTATLADTNIDRYDHARTSIDEVDTGLEQQTSVTPSTSYVGVTSRLV